MVKSAQIQTERLLINPFSEKYLSLQYVNWLNDPEVVRFSDQRRYKHSLESCREYWKSFTDSPNYFWAVVEMGDEPRHIGNMNTYVDKNNLIADIGILIGEKSVWGKGYGLEAWMAVCNYLLTDAKIRKITAGALSTNTRMLSIMRHAGMFEECRRIRHAFFEGDYVDIVHYALFK
jgi:[ribosomal protein S5]-alanine N-acetyltransferase